MDWPFYWRYGVIIPGNQPRFKRTKLAASAWIINENKILVVQRAKEPTEGKWAPVGGEKDERDKNLEQTVIREAKEEVGLVIEVKRKIGTYLTLNEEYQIVNFLAETKNPSLEINQDEIQDAKWLKPEEILSLDLTSTARQALEDFIKIKATR